MPLKSLPLDVSSFETMISKNYLYIDKTQYIYNMFGGGNRYYFLSRPRRFGKSLLVSTLKEMFLGKKELFKGLWIYNSDYEWQEHPVIHLDFSHIAHRTTQQLEQAIIKNLHRIAGEYNLQLQGNQSPEGMFDDLILELSKINKVVVLIDEYDKPILDHMHNLEEAKKQREILKSFYGIIKGVDAHLRAVFLTGVTKFSKTSIFSGINNLNDISLDSPAAALLGYTQEEVTHYFKEYIDAFAQKSNKTSQEIMHELQMWYNGFRFSEENIKVYNPFSVLYCLSKQKFLNYWFKSGTPSFLVHLLKQKAETLKDIKNIEIDSSGLESFDLDKLPLITLLFQAGYLTISDYDPKTKLFILNYPNYEVAESFTKYLLATFTHTETAEVKRLSIDLLNALQKNNLDNFCNLLKTFFAHIPYSLQVKKESFYHALLQAIFTLLSLDAHSEVITDKGRIDLVLAIENFIYIFELKFDSTPQVALQQIKDRKYYERFLHQGKQVILVGLSFNLVNEQLNMEYTSEILE